MENKPKRIKNILAYLQEDVPEIETAPPDTENPEDQLDTSVPLDVEKKKKKLLL